MRTSIHKDKVSKLFEDLPFTQKQVAEYLKLEQSTSITKWKKLGVVPATHCAKLKLLSGGKIQLHELNPAAFPVPDHLLLSCDKDALAQAGYCVESLAVLRPKLATNKHAA